MSVHDDSQCLFGVEPTAGYAADGGDFAADLASGLADAHLSAIKTERESARKVRAKSDHDSGNCLSNECDYCNKEINGPRKQGCGWREPQRSDGWANGDTNNSGGWIVPGEAKESCETAQGDGRDSSVQKPGIWNSANVRPPSPTNAITSETNETADMKARINNLEQVVNDLRARLDEKLDQGVNTTQATTLPTTWANISANYRAAPFNPPKMSYSSGSQESNHLSPCSGNGGPWTGLTMAEAGLPLFNRDGTIQSIVSRSAAFKTRADEYVPILDSFGVEPKIPRGLGPNLSFSELDHQYRRAAMARDHGKTAGRGNDGFCGDGLGGW